MAKRNYSMTDIESWKFNKVDLPDEWFNHLGDITENFRMIIEGKPGHGKTEYVIKLAKTLANHYGKVTINNVEQGRSATLQDAFLRNKVSEVKPGRLMLCDKSQIVFETWFERLKRPNSGRVVILDSLDYMKLTIDQFKLMHERFKHKSIIIVCWNDPMDTNAKKIRYMCDIKVDVVDFVARIRSRFGGNKPFDVWPEKHKKKVPAMSDLFNQNGNGN